MKNLLNIFKIKEKRVYLDHAGATPLGARARHALLSSLDIFGNPSAIYEEGVISKRILQEARKDISEVLSCRSHELYFTGTGTESVALALEGPVRAFEEKQRGKSEKVVPHIITTEIEHPAVRELYKTLEKEGRVTVSFLPVDEWGLIKVSAVKEALREETILVSLMYVNNEIGSIMPIKEVGRMLALYKEEKKQKEKSVYPYFHTDACQAANYLSLDVNSLRVDLMTVNSSKVYGPKGVALLYKKEKVSLSPVIVGGGQERGLRSGTEAISLIASFAAAMKETKALRDSEAARLWELVLLTKKKLEKSIPSVMFYGSFEKGKRVSNNLNFRIPSLQSDEMILRLDALGFSVSHKSACASEDESMSYVIKALGASDEEASENIRVTLGRSTTKKDMDSFVEAVKNITQLYARPVKDPREQV